MSDQAVFDCLLERLDLPLDGANIVTAEELASWLYATTDALLRVGLLEATTPRLTVACPDCEDDPYRELVLIEPKASC